MPFLSSCKIEYLSISEPQISKVRYAVNLVNQLTIFTNEGFCNWKKILILWLKSDLNCIDIISKQDPKVISFQGLILDSVVVIIFPACLLLVLLN